MYQLASPSNSVLASENEGGRLDCAFRAKGFSEPAGEGCLPCSKLAREQDQVTKLQQIGQLASQLLHGLGGSYC